MIKSGSKTNMKFLISLFLILLCLSFNISSSANCPTGSSYNHVLAQSEELSPLQLLIFDIRDVIDLIEQEDNETAITILKSASKQVRKVKEFSARDKKTTEKRIKKGIKLLKQGKSDDALALLQTGIDELVAAGLADPSDFE